MVTFYDYSALWLRYDKESFTFTLTFVGTEKLYGYLSVVNMLNSNQSTGLVYTKQEIVLLFVCT